MRNIFKSSPPAPQPAPPIPTPSTGNASANLTFATPPRVLIIGAGSRGSGYAAAAQRATNARIAAVAEPVPFKRAEFGRRFVWGARGPAPGEQFEGWAQWVGYEVVRRGRERAGERVERGVDAVMVCVLDEMHVEVLCAVAPLGLHVLCEKPLATSLEGCVRIWRALGGVGGGVWKEEGEGERREGEVVGTEEGKGPVFGICHVLRYSPHNMLLRELLLEKEVVGDVLSIEHVEPVGWWHFSHSYVRYVGLLF